MIQQVFDSETLNFLRSFIYSLHSLGNVYIGDFTNNRIRKVTVSTGIITTIAGTGSGTYNGDNGPAISAALNKPSRVTLDSLGNSLM